VVGADSRFVFFGSSFVFNDIVGSFGNPASWRAEGRRGETGITNGWLCDGTVDSMACGDAPPGN